MIKDFPEFGQLELSDKNEIEKLTADFLHYSDFSFNNLWGRDIAPTKRGYSKLNGNLIIRMFRYKTNEQFFSICGLNMPNETVNTLLKFMKKEGLISPIRLIPEEFVKKITFPDVVIEEDRDSFDYIYLNDELKSFEGGKFKQKRNEVNTLLAEYPKIEVKELNIKDPSVKREISCLFHRWTENKMGKESELESNESDIFNDTLILSETYSPMLLGIYIKNEMVAFLIYEIRNQKYAIGYFAKTDSAIRGINSFLLQSLAKILSARGIKYFNYEEDVGLQNLQTAKLRFRPVFFLKKYTLNLKNS